jgi:uncharacterized protein
MASLEQGIEAYEELDFTRAFEILIKFAQAGEADAQKIIGHMYSFGQGVQQDDSEAIRWYRLAAEQGDRVAQNNLASYLLDEKFEEAIKWYVASAEQNFPFAQDALGDIFSGSLANSDAYINKDQALKWYSRAAENGFVSACHKVAELYRDSTIPQNDLLAVEWYERAAAAGYPPSQLTLGQAYQEGSLGLPQDLGKAQYWLGKYRSNNTRGASAGM